MDKAKIEEAVAEFVKNPYWKGIYDNAPPLAKQYYGIVFANSEGKVDENEAKEETLAMYKAFGDADWDYVIANTENKMVAWGMQKNREKYQTAQEKQDNEG